MQELEAEVGQILVPYLLLFAFLDFGRNCTFFVLIFHFPMLDILYPLSLQVSFQFILHELEGFCIVSVLLSRTFQRLEHKKEEFSFRNSQGF